MSWLLQPYSPTPSVSTATNSTKAASSLPSTVYLHGTPLRAGNSYRFFRPLHPDDIITVTRKVTRVWQRQGRTGSLTFQEIEITYRNQHNDRLAVNTEVLLYRDPTEGDDS